MSATNLTKNLKLSQFLASDKPSWLGDVNGDNKKIDDGYGVLAGDISKANDTAASAKSQSDANTQTLANVNTELEDYGNRITALEAGGGTEQLEQRINTLGTDVEALQTRADTFEEEIAQNGTNITALKSRIDAVEPKVKTNADNITSLQTTTSELSSTLKETTTTANSAKELATTANNNASQALTLASNANKTANSNSTSISTINSKLSAINVLNLNLVQNSYETHTLSNVSDMLAFKTGENTLLLSFGITINKSEQLNSTGILIGKYTFNEYANKQALFNDITVYGPIGFIYEIKGTFSNGELNIYLASASNSASQPGYSFTLNTSITFY